MAMDFNEMRLIVEAAKKRGAIQSPGDPAVSAQPQSKSNEPGGAVLPDWLQRDDTYKDSFRGSRRW
jgi:hypothetical protein